MQNGLGGGIPCSVVSLVGGLSCLDVALPWFLPAFQPWSLWLALTLGTPDIIKITAPFPTEPEDNRYLDPQVQRLASFSRPSEVLIFGFRFGDSICSFLCRTPVHLPVCQVSARTLS